MSFRSQRMCFSYGTSNLSRTEFRFAGKLISKAFSEKGERKTLQSNCVFFCSDSLTAGSESNKMIKAPALEMLSDTKNRWSRNSFPHTPQFHPVLFHIRKRLIFRLVVHQVLIIFLVNFILCNKHNKSINFNSRPQDRVKLIFRRNRKKWISSLSFSRSQKKSLFGPKSLKVEKIISKASFMTLISTSPTKK